MKNIVKKMVPILIVPSIEECLPLWRDRLGYAVETEVPHEGKLGFVILKQGDSEVMLQTQASVAADLTSATQKIDREHVLLYADVDSLDLVTENLEGATIIVPRRKTFYGANEVWIRTNSGHVLGFAQF
jgi:uncharacterized glyoxalase superfamily protein PhnB